MVLSATSPIPPGQPLLLSYFEGPTDEFLLHYGFVPPGNPQDVVQLAGDLRGALEGCWRGEAGEAARLVSASRRYACLVKPLAPR